MDISVREEAFQTEDRSWLGSSHGIHNPKTGTLAVDTLTENTHYPNGYVPSGTLLGKITSGDNEGCWGPYDNGASDGRQTAVGWLFSSKPVSATGAERIGIAVLLHGQIREANLPEDSGLDANAKTDLAAHFTFV